MSNNNDIIEQQPKKLEFYALCGIIAQILFWFMVIIESLLRPGYSQFYNYVSDLGVGPLAILQNINFIILGFLTIGLGLGLRIGLPTQQGKTLKLGVWFVLIFALGVLFAGIFPENYLSQVPHNIVSATAFIAIIVAQLLIWQGLKRENNSIWGN